MNDLNQYLQPLNAPVTQERPVIGMTFDTGYEVQTNRIRASQLNVDNMVVPSNVGTAGASFTTGEAVTVEAILSPSVSFTDAYNFGNIFISVYQGTAVDGDYQMFPRLGASMTLGDYKFSAGYDYNQDVGGGETAYNTYNSVYRLFIENVAAGAQSIYIIAEWKYIQDRFGVSTA